MANWYFPPTTNKRGESRDPYDTKSIVVMETELFSEPTIAMSDIHSHTPELLPMLEKFVNLNEFVVLTMGDMAGPKISNCVGNFGSEKFNFKQTLSGLHVFGADGDPTKEYEFLAERTKEFYFVQGNHDLPSKNDSQKTIKNKSGLLSYIENGTVQSTCLGLIGGINGTISDNPHPYKMPHDKFFDYMRAILSKTPLIVMTHETPSIPINYDNGDRYVGKIELFDTVNESESKPLIYLYGHCHHPTIINKINSVNYINVDGRVVIFLPISKGGMKMYDDKKYFKSKLRNMYSPSAKKL
jgi:Icc-related predicted phosphoesterase